jgi:hypothetical protein
MCGAPKSAAELMSKAAITTAMMQKKMNVHRRPKRDGQQPL